jgi:hypothetical protein
MSGPSAIRREAVQREGNGLIHHVYGLPRQEGCFFAVPTNVRDAYVEGEIVLHLHVRGSLVAPEGQDWCVRSDRAERDIDHTFRTRGKAAVGVIETSGEQNAELDGPMLVLVVILLKSTERREDKLIRAPARLQPLDRCLRRHAEGLEVPNTSVPLGVVLGDQELKSFVVGRGINTGLLDADGVNGVIERAPEVVNSIAEHERPLLQQRVTREIDIETVLQHVGIRLGTDSIGMSFKEGFGLPLKALEVDLSPVVLGDSAGGNPAHGDTIYAATSDGAS